jgi:hypothetical protein
MTVINSTSVKPALERAAIGRSPEADWGELFMDKSFAAEYPGEEP